MTKDSVHVLVVDDEAGMRDLLSMEFGARGYHVVTACDGQEAVERFQKEEFQLVISDVMMPRMDGLTALETMKNINPDVEVIITTGFGSIETAVKAMKKGAYDFVQKPFNLDEIILLAEKALEKSDLKALLALYESSKAIFSTIKLDQLFGIVTDLVQKVLHADESSLMLLNSENRLYIAASHGNDRELEEVSLGLGERIAGKVAELRQGFLLVNGLKNYPEFQGLKGNGRIQSSIVIPLLNRDELLGVLNLNRTTHPHNFTSSDMRNASIFASQLSQAIQNAKLYQSLEAKMEELKEAQTQLIEAEKAVVLAQLAAGVAHEVRNPLAILQQGIEYVLNSAKDPDADRVSILKQMEDAIERADYIIRALMDLSRPSRAAFSVEDINATIESSLLLVKNKMDSRHIQIVKKYAGAIPPIPLDRGKMTQVFINLFTNAADAMGDAGQLKVKTYLKKMEDSRESVIIEVEDTGAGIAEEVLPKIFDPFFTTKRGRGGTGLGLPIVRTIVELHKGSIDIRNGESKGAKVTLVLPLEYESKQKKASEVAKC